MYITSILQNSTDAKLLKTPLSQKEIDDYKSSYCVLKKTVDKALSGNGDAILVSNAQSAYLDSYNQISTHLTVVNIIKKSDARRVQGWLNAIQAASSPDMQKFSVTLGRLNCPQGDSAASPNPSDCDQDYILTGKGFRANIGGHALRYFNEDIGTIFSGFSVFRDCGGGLKLNNLGSGFGCPVTGVVFSNTLPDGKVQEMTMNQLGITTDDWYTVMETKVQTF